MTDIEQTLAEIRRRDEMYPNFEITVGAVQDRRTLLNIIRELQNHITELEGLIECENPHCDMACHEA